MNGKQRRILKQQTRKPLASICDCNPKGSVKVKGGYTLFFDKNGGLWNIVPKAQEVLNTHRGQMRSINLINNLQAELNYEVL